ncbi:MAG: hypothetical protein ACRD4L_00190, partial [Pyrinomonadaceae bacterium]
MIHMILACCLLVASIPQEIAVIDATGEQKQFSRKVVSGSVSTTHNPLPVQLQVLAYDSKVKQGGSLLVDFVITNDGPQPISLPVSVDPGKVEPRWPAPRSFKSLFLYAATHESLLKGEASLYGAPDA